MEKEKNRKGFVYKIKMHLTKEPEVQSYRLLSLLSLPIDICLQRILHLPKSAGRQPKAVGWHSHRAWQDPDPPRTLATGTTDPGCEFSSLLWP